MNELFNAFIAFIAAHFGDTVAVTVGNGIGFNFVLPLLAVAIYVLTVMGVIK